MASMIGLLVVALIAALVYKYYFSTLKTSGGGTPKQVINIVGVKSDLIGIAQAERLYQAQNGSYASLDQLKSSSALAINSSGRDGYTYDVETSDGAFRAVAHCLASTSPGCTDWVVDQTMEVHPVP